MSNKFKIRLCPRAHNEHRASTRQFAHTLHRPGVVCVAPAFYDLPAEFQAGILIHELGHIALAGQKHNEHQADIMGSIISNVEITRRPYGKLKNLEYVEPTDLQTAREFLTRYVTNNPLQ